MASPPDSPPTAASAATSAGAHPAPARPLWRTFLAFVGPMMVSNILQALSGTINSIYLGQMIGVHALAAASASFPLVFFLISFVIGLGAGSSVLIGQAWGARLPDRVRAVAGSTLAATLIAGALVAVLGGFFTQPLLELLGTPADVLADATAYARIMLIAMPGLFLYLLGTAMLRGVGDTVTPLLALTLSTSVSLLITPALIRGWGGLPRLGLLGGAWASVVSFVVALLWMSWRMRSQGHPLAPDRQLARHIRLDRQILGKVLRIGVPTGVQVITMSLAALALLSMVNGFGSQATAAYGAVNQILAYVQFPALSIAITASILGAHAIGAGRTETLGHITRTGLRMTLVMTGSLILVAYAASTRILGLFVTDASVLALAQRLLHISMWSEVVYGMAAVLSGVMRASGTVWTPTSISVGSLLLIEVPVAWLLSRQWGIDGVWCAYPVTFAAMLMLQAAYYRFSWRGRPVERLI